MNFITKDEGLKKLKSLIETFDLHKDEIKKTFKEENIRSQFIDNFFKCLGWDVDNSIQKASPNLQDVIVEDRIMIDNNLKSPDYCFRLNNRRQFYVEAKNTTVKIETDIAPAYQLRRYAWNAKLPLSILTDFEEFALYDCTINPSNKDSAKKCRLKYLLYTEYVENFDWFWDLFSRDNVLNGSLETIVSQEKRGNNTVDKKFLQSLDEWRIRLAENILKNNNLDKYQLNEIVQATLNRIIFLRNCEDRNIQTYGVLKEIINNDSNYYNQLLNIFDEANTKFNAGLFDLSELSKKIIIDNSIISEIIENLYYPSPYIFSVISSEILGTAYEKFLGKTINIENNKIDVDLKPEVRKAGGVYYTPQYIVDYIVKNTIGKHIEGKSPKVISKMKFCDPSCGSGSFLLGVYDYLLTYHQQWYFNKRNKGQKVKQLNSDGTLKQDVKKEILLNNIYGVDIDKQAIEVTKLSLLIKCLEGESNTTLQLSLNLQGVLPTLDNNIVDGNSLIDFSFYDGKINSFINRDINVFDWKETFKKVFKDNEGFDIIIGNPPYLNGRSHREIFSEQRDFLTDSTQYETLHEKWDLYIPFIEKSINLLKNKGLVSMIIPHPFINQKYSRLIREEIIKHHEIIEITDLFGVKVFEDATVDNIIFFVKKNSNKNKLKITKAFQKKPKQIVLLKEIDKKSLVVGGLENWKLTDTATINLQDSKYFKLGDLCYISKGIVPNAHLEKVEKKDRFIKKDLVYLEKPNISHVEYLEGKDIDKYVKNETRYIEWNTNRVPLLISRPTFPELHQGKKIICNKLGVLKATIDVNTVCDQTLRIFKLWKDIKNVNNKSISLSLKKQESKYSRKQIEEFSKDYSYNEILGILNSSLCLKLLNQIRGENNKDLNPNYLKEIPIPQKNNDNKKYFKEIEKRVSTLLDLKSKDIESMQDFEQKHINGMINQNINAIEELVKMLYI